MSFLPMDNDWNGGWKGGGVGRPGGPVGPGPAPRPAPAPRPSPQPTPGISRRPNRPRLTPGGGGQLGPAALNAFRAWRARHGREFDDNRPAPAQPAPAQPAPPPPPPIPEMQNMGRAPRAGVRLPEWGPDARQQQQGMGMGMPSPQQPPAWGRQPGFGGGRAGRPGGDTFGSFGSGFGG
jgi:hypothetical protein